MISTVYCALMLVSRQGFGEDKIERQRHWQAPIDDDDCRHLRQSKAVQRHKTCIKKLNYKAVAKTDVWRLNKTDWFKLTPIQAGLSQCVRELQMANFTCPCDWEGPNARIYQLGRTHLTATSPLWSTTSNCSIWFRSKTTESNIL